MVRRTTALSLLLALGGAACAQHTHDHYPLPGQEGAIPGSYALRAAGLPSGIGIATDPYVEENSGLETSIGTAVAGTAGTETETRAGQGGQAMGSSTPPKLTVGAGNGLQTGLGGAGTGRPVAGAGSAAEAGAGGTGTAATDQLRTGRGPTTSIGAGSGRISTGIGSTASSGGAVTTFGSESGAVQTGIGSTAGAGVTEPVGPGAGGIPGVGGPGPADPGDAGALPPLGGTATGAGGLSAGGGSTE